LIALKDIKSPADLKDLSAKELLVIADDIRRTIIQGVSQTGGHLASSLGVVELTIALHKVFNTPTDKIIWDVGHQCYPHKLLTGRQDNFHTLRKFQGMGGFPKRVESQYDAFDTGHSSTSISAAVGMIAARDVKGGDNKVIAVIGDGSMTAGLAFEGLNHAGQIGKDLIVVLNDNEMSISPNVGALSQYLNRILTGDRYRRLKKETKALIESIPKLGLPVAKMAEKVEESVKGIFLPGMLFEELGFNYVGPIDGHNLQLLLDTFSKVKTFDSPTLIHLITKKGKGYEFAEEDPCTYHGVGPFETANPVKSNCKPAVASYSDVFGEALTEIADSNPKVVAITAAMREGTGLSVFAQKHPERIFDVGIAEPHAATFAAGMAAEGIKPVVAIYSTFLQRSYDEIVHDVCLQNLPVVFALDRAGIVGDDGPTHNGVFDLSYLRHVPNLVLLAPKDGPELKAMLQFSINYDGPVAIRYPRGKIIDLGTQVDVALGKAETMREGSDVAILAIGNMVEPSLKAAELLSAQGVSATVVNMRFVKPLDTDLLNHIATSHERIVTVEENVLQGGFGSAVNEFYAKDGIRDITLTCIGIPDEFVEQGSQAQMRKIYGLDAEGIDAAIIALMKDNTKKV
jgi:1-deoxy-D-xylulose-5-phosphate synthase